MTQDSGKSGSSPHTRGLREEESFSDCPGRIIPAHAGFTNEEMLKNAFLGDHPRTRGVYSGRHSIPMPAGGSSPHTRGLPHHYAEHHMPAGDHPRTRGVYGRRDCSPALIVGSSPHTRGLRVGVVCPRLGVGIIPAHAGFTPWCVGSSYILLDHPRTRGVYQEHRQQQIEYGGSSPHTRGLRINKRPNCLHRRIIPAHAGFTTQYWGQCRRAPDHPRTRGVYARACGNRRH